MYASEHVLPCIFHIAAQSQRCVCNCHIGTCDCDMWHIWKREPVFQNPLVHLHQQQEQAPYRQIPSQFFVTKCISQVGDLLQMLDHKINTFASRNGFSTPRRCPHCHPKHTRRTSYNRRHMRQEWRVCCDLAGCSVCQEAKAMT